MPGMYKSVIPNKMGEKNPRKKVIALGKKITDVAVHKLTGISSNDPEYWGLAEILTDEMVDVGLAMKLRTPYTFEEMMKICGKKEEEREAFQKVLDEMAYIGIIEYDYGYHYDHNGRTAPQSERRYILPMFVPGSAELFNMEEDFETGENNRLKTNPELASFFERMTYIPLDGVTQMVPEGGAGIGMHVIPVEKAIEMNNEAMDIEKLSYWLKKYEGHIGVGQCSCRASRAVLGEGCADDKESWCIGVGDFADYCRETGKGHDITVEEALAILKRAEDNGFVHQTTNIDGENKIFGICNCNVNICNALRTSQLFNTPNLSASAYTAEVTPENCVACGRCVEYCPAGAVKLGQKLCTKNGPVVYPRHELPDNKKWGKDKYDENYRDNNRINCYSTGTAPCKTACPAHVAVQGYLKMVKEGRYTDALALIKKENPFPAICGRVCNKRCEDACTRGTIDKAVSIDAVKKFVAELDLNAETRYVPEIIMPVSPARRFPLTQWSQKIAIIGGGPAGLTCAYYLATIGYKPTVFEKHEKPGGMMVYGIPSYKLQKDVVEAEIDVLRQLGVEFKCGVEVGKDVTLAQLREEGYKAFYIAIGCSAGKRPGVPGDDAEGTMTAIEYLAEANTGKTSFDGRVVVVGGGNVAVDAARVSKRSGASEVTMLCLENEVEMPASKEEQKESREDGVKIMNSWGPKEVLVEDGKVKGIVFKKCLSVKNAEGRFAPTYDENDTITIECERVIFAVGQATVWGGLLKGENVEFQGPRVVADPLTYQTSQPDIFVGGDLYTGPKFVIDAIAGGHQAANVLHRYVQPNASLTIGLNRRQFIELDKNNIEVGGYDTADRQVAGINEAVDKMGFEDASLPLTEEQAKIEANRCLSCGASVVDPNKCIGCGVCTTKCEFDAIHLYRTHPDRSNLRVAEDKFKYIIPYQLKRMGRILVGYQSPEEKAYEKKYKEFCAKNGTR